jgi:hypothetical protein
MMARSLLLAMALSTPAAAAQWYSATGTHLCANGHTCVVTGSFGDCEEAAGFLRTRDCCHVESTGGISARFTLNYCIPARSDR